MHSILNKIEDVINDTLKGSQRMNAHEFITHLRGNEEFSFSKDENDDKRWWVKFKDHLMCEIQFNNLPEGWSVWVYGDCIGRHDSVIDENIKEIAWASITLCVDCGAGCAPGRHKTVLGKGFDNICQSTLAFSNPKTSTLDCLKIIVSVIKEDVIRQ